MTERLTFPTVIQTQPDISLPLEIVRPFELKISLIDHGPAVVFDEKFVLSFKDMYLGGNAGRRGVILITRDRNVPPIFKEEKRERMFPYSNPEERIGRAGTIFYFTASDREGKGFYVGQQYDVTYRGRFPLQPLQPPEGDSFVNIAIKSTGAIRTEEIPGFLNFDTYLEEIWRNRKRFEISNT